MEINARRLKKLRETKVLSQRELAVIAGVTHQTVWRFENGFREAHPRTIRKLASALSVQPRELAKAKE